MKYLTTLLALAALSTSTLAQDGLRDRVERPRIDAVVERIKSALDGDLSERRKAYLEHRLAYLELHVEMRQALRDAFGELGGDASDEERMAARESVRDQFADQLQIVKDQRREIAKKRRANRGDDTSADG
jgi:putative component of toxin-antitoxin plasmid stabilization module